MDGRLIVFDDLVRCVIDGEATAEEFHDLVAMMRDDPALQRRYCHQMHVHALLTCHKGQVWPEDGEVLASANSSVRESGKRDAGGQRPAAGNRWGRCGWWTAAAAAVLLAGAGVWRHAGGVRIPAPVPSASAASPVLMLRQSGVAGLDLPKALPGTVRLAAGEAVVRLGSGVELTLLGPLAMEVQDAMQVRLESGRLLVNVPPVACGFTVLTEALELYDLGTVFSVLSDGRNSDVFVFKGSVQVNEASGEGVGLCEAGEGVRAATDGQAVKVAADWPEAQKLFRTVRGETALNNPGVALTVAGRIGDLWADRYMPDEAWLVRDRAAREIALRHVAMRGPFSKSAWVQSPVPARQEEESSMSKGNAAAVWSAVALTMATGTAGAVSLPIRVDTSPNHNRHWTTAFTNEIPLRWEWNAAASSAELKAVGMNGSFATNFTAVTSNYLWRAFTSGVPAAEEMFDLTLTFYNGGDAVVGVLTSRLAFVTAAFGRAAIDPGPSDKRWASVKENVVIPYDAGWAKATAGALASRLAIAKRGGAAQTHALADASGYFGWKLKHSDWGTGTFDLSLTFPGAEGEWDATLTRPASGLMISVK